MGDINSNDCQLLRRYPGGPRTMGNTSLVLKERMFARMRRWIGRTNFMKMAILPKSDPIQSSSKFQLRSLKKQQKY